MGVSHDQAVLTTRLIADGINPDKAAATAADIAAKQLARAFTLSAPHYQPPGKAAFAKVSERVAAGKVKELLPSVFPSWRDDQRAIANELSRCALFNYCDVRMQRKYRDNVKLFSLGDGQVFYKGEELRENDEIVFVTLAHLARRLPAQQMVVDVTSSDICKLNNWRQSQHYYSMIFLSIQRMKASSLTIISKRLALALALQNARDHGASTEELARLHGEIERADANADLPDVNAAGLLCSLVRDARFQGVKSIENDIPQGNLSWQIELDRNMAALFARPWVTLVDAKARQALSGKGRRLQMYFSSNAKPYPVRLRSLANLLGLQVRQTNQLKFILHKEFLALKAEGVIADFTYRRCAGEDDWLVEATR